MNDLLRLLSLIYLFSVVLCICLAFNFEGSVHLEWTIVLIVLTLPGSIVSILYGWSLFHGAGLPFFAVVHLVSAVVNILLLNAAIRFFRKRSEKPLATSLNL